MFQRMQATEEGAIKNQEFTKEVAIKDFSARGMEYSVACVDVCSASCSSSLPSNTISMMTLTNGLPPRCVPLLAPGNSNLCHHRSLGWSHDRTDTQSTACRCGSEQTPRRISMAADVEFGVRDMVRSTSYSICILYIGEPAHPTIPRALGGGPLYQARHRPEAWHKRVVSSQHDAVAKTLLMTGGRRRENFTVLSM